MERLLFLQACAGIVVCMGARRNIISSGFHDTGDAERRGTVELGEVPETANFEKNTYYLWGANEDNYYMQYIKHDGSYNVDAGLNGGGMAGPNGPTKGKAHERYVGIITTTYDERSSVDRLINKNGRVWSFLEKKLKEGASVVVPTLKGSYSLGTGLARGQCTRHEWYQLQHSIFDALKKLGLEGGTIIKSWHDHGEQILYEKSLDDLIAYTLNGRVQGQQASGTEAPRKALHPLPPSIGIGQFRIDTPPLNRSFGRFGEKTIIADKDGKRSIEEFCGRYGFSDAWHAYWREDESELFYMTKLPVLVIIKLLQSSAVDDSVKAEIEGNAFSIGYLQQHVAMNVVVRYHGLETNAIDKFSLLYPDDPKAQVRGSHFALEDGFSWRTGIIDAHILGQGNELNAARGGIGSLADETGWILLSIEDAIYKPGIANCYKGTCYVGKDDKIRALKRAVDEFFKAAPPRSLKPSYNPANAGITLAKEEFDLFLAEVGPQTATAVLKDGITITTKAPEGISTAAKDAAIHKSHLSSGVAGLMITFLAMCKEKC